MVSWQFLLVGSFGAVGLAMSFGTAAAIVRYRRTGVFPGQEETAEPPTRRQMIGMGVRIGVGLILGVAAFVSLQAADLI